MTSMTPWVAKAIAGTGGADNPFRQRKARKAKSLCETQTGLTEEQLREFQAEQRRRVLARYGIERS